MALDAALIGLAGVLLGILVSKVLERVLDARKRRDREIDMVFAIHAEISAGRSALQDQNAPDRLAFLAEDEFPSGPADRSDFIFEALKSDFSVLHQQVIHQTVLYYRLAIQSNILIDYLASEAYQRLTPDERRSFRRNMIAGLLDQEIAADRALNSLESFMQSAGFEPPARSRVRSDEGANGADHVSSP